MMRLPILILISLPAGCSHLDATEEKRLSLEADCDNDTIILRVEGDIYEDEKRVSPTR